jgi:alanyl-tRNA synthetase
MPDSPNLLFTNAGMNQFVPIFLGQKKPDVSKWAGAVPGLDTRAADTQKCIRAGGKHNDLDDVGLDTYHHTFFEMLGNWSFGDYFKKEAIEWAWELVVEKWKFPPSRLYATVYSPDKSQNDPSEFDQEAWNYWAEKFRSVGQDPKIHVVNGNKKDNFWMMGETGPCGPCSELHVDLTPDGKTEGRLVNKGVPECIEIWNLVFIQFNAEPDGPENEAKMKAGGKVGEDWFQKFVPLPAKHVDTGMGFERVTSIIQGTKDLKDFANAKISNYETDIFRPIFDVLEKLSGKKYGSTLPGKSDSWQNQPVKSTGESPSPIIEVDRGTDGTDVSRAVAAQEIQRSSNDQVAIDIAFRVIADHIRTLSFAIADGIEPGNKERNAVLRRILRRAAMFGRSLGFHEPFFYKLVDVVAHTMGDVFPEVRINKNRVQDIIRREEEAFGRTVDVGMELFDEAVLSQNRCVEMLSEVKSLYHAIQDAVSVPDVPEVVQKKFKAVTSEVSKFHDLMTECELSDAFQEGVDLQTNASVVYNAYLVRESSPDELKGWSQGLEKFLSMIGQSIGRIEDLGARKLLSGRTAFKLSATYGLPIEEITRLAKDRGLAVDTTEFDKLNKQHQIISGAGQTKQIIELSQLETKAPTRFVGYDSLSTDGKVLEVVGVKDKTAVVLDSSPLYAEMGGQVGDTGELSLGGQLWRISNTQKSGNTWLHFIDGGEAPAVGASVSITVEKPRRNAIQRHHTVTHLLHWALHEVVSKEASQKGSFVGSDKLTFDFNSAPLIPQQVADIEKLVNERILGNAGVSWTEVPYGEVKGRKDVMQFFGEKYGDTVRVVQIGGQARKLDGYSMELCGGTHTRATGEIGLFRIVGESAIAAGVRRIEAVAGLEAYRKATDEVSLIKLLAGKVNSPIHELDKKIEALLAHQKEMEKQLKSAQQREASNAASRLLEEVQTVNGIPAIIHNLGGVDGDFLQAVADSLKGRIKGVIVLGGGVTKDSVALVAAVTPEYTAKIQAGKIIQQIAPIVGGKGGGKPDNARGGGKDASKLDEALAKANSLIG